MKRILALGIASLMVVSISAMADENVAAERFNQRATNWGGTLKTAKSANQGRNTYRYARPYRPSFNRRMPPSQENNFPTSSGASYNTTPNYSVTR